MSNSQGFKDLTVWKKSKELVLEIYKITEKFPRKEDFVLTAQMRRTAISIPSNIAEGYHRHTSKEKYHFTWIAFGSGSELEAQMDIAKSIYPTINFHKAEEVHKHVTVLLYKHLKNK